MHVYIYIYIYIYIHIPDGRRGLAHARDLGGVEGATSAHVGFARYYHYDVYIYIYIYINDNKRNNNNNNNNSAHVGFAGSAESKAPYGRFPKFHRVSLGRDPGTLKSDIVSTKISTINLFGFETLKLKIRMSSKEYGFLESDERQKHCLGRGLLFHRRQPPYPN